MFSLDPETTKLVRDLRKHPIFPDSGDPSGVKTSEVLVEYGPREVERLIPHRPPMRFVDSISAIDLVGRRIRGARTLDPADPIFLGHFPARPVYPGVLQVETMGQLALCLTLFLTKCTTELREDFAPVDVRALRIIHAQYFEPLLPGDFLQLQAAILDEDGMTATAAGQIIKEGRIVSLSLQEVYFVE